MDKRKIYVGIEHKNVFDSICALINGKCFEGLNYSAKNGIISAGDFEFVLSEKKTTKKEEQKFTFGKNGASWFKPLRGEKTPDDDAIWNTFRSNVAIEYHKRFSVVEYKKRPPSMEETTRAQQIATNAGNLFCQTFYNFLEDEIDVKPIKNYDTEDIFGVAVKIELSGGTGASLPVLGRIYFSKKGKILTPLTTDVATALDQNIKSLIPEDDGDNNLATDDSVIINALDAMDSLIDNPNNNFADYLCFSDDEDLRIVNDLLEKLSHSAIELECQRVDVLYITHVQTNSFAYNIISKNKTLFNMTLGINDTVTISCANCQKGAVLVARNQISFTKPSGEKVNYYLDFNTQNLGLSDSQIEEILEYSDLQKHVKSIACQSGNGKTLCSCFKCDSQLFVAPIGEQLRYACLDCPYPEIVYVNKDGDTFYTPNLTFAFDKKDLVDDTTPTAYCSKCGRAFSESALVGGQCKTCRDAEGANVEKAKLLYKRYKDFLPLSTRMSPTKKKYCYEDEEIILFVVGKKQYIFNKLNVKEFGYVPKPKRIK